MASTEPIVSRSLSLSSFHPSQNSVSTPDCAKAFHAAAETCPLLSSRATCVIRSSPVFATSLRRMNTPTRSEPRSEEHTSELQSLMRISYAVFCLKKKKNNKTTNHITHTNQKKN